MTRRYYTRDDILNALREAVQNTSPALTGADFERLTGISHGPVIRHFGSWTGLRAAAGLPRRGLRAAGNEQGRREFLLAEARRLAAIHGDRLTLRRFCRELGIGASSILRYFDSWHALRRHVGLTTPRARRQWTWTPQVLLEEYERVTRQLRRCPGLHEFARHARCSERPVIDRFGSIRGLQVAFRDWLQHRARQPGPDAQPARHLLDWCVDLYVPFGHRSRNGRTREHATP